jgi:hypothetical protein
MRRAVAGAWLVQRLWLEYAEEPVLPTLMGVVGEAVELVGDGPLIALAVSAGGRRCDAADRSTDFLRRVPRVRRGEAVLLGNPVREGAGDRGGAAGDLQPFVDVFQVGAHGSLGDAQPAGDLGVGVAGGQQAQQVLLPGGEPGNGVAAALGVQVGLVQVRAQQREHRPVTLGEVRPGSAVQLQPQVPPGPGGVRRRFGQAQHESVLQS